MDSNNWVAIVIILCDVDGVLANFVGSVLETLRPISPRLHEADITHLDLSKSLATKELEYLEKFCHQPGWCERIKWYDGAHLFLRSLLLRLDDVHAVTAPWKCDTWCAERTRWLKPHFDERHITFTQAKYLVDGDVLIEDSAAHLDNWVERHPFGLGILIDRPWNRRDQPSRFLDKNKWIRVRSYDEAVNLIEKHSEAVIR